MAEIIRAVVGLMFTEDRKQLVVIQKAKKPGIEWMAGLLNGPGGKVEPNERADEAMRREFLEETGIEYDYWKFVAAVEGSKTHVLYFRAFSDLAWQAKTQEQEPVFLMPPWLLWDTCVPNLRTMIALSLSDLTLHGHFYPEYRSSEPWHVATS